MKQQILTIHGGSASETYEEYLEELRTREVFLDRMRGGGWKENLQKVLGEEYDVLLPKMPNATNARYAEWKIWFEKIIPLLDNEIIFIGHSLGAIFLVKYLAENNCPKKIKATMLVAPPYNTPEIHSLVDFNIETDLGKFAEQGGKIFIYHSKDDEIVPFSNC